MVPRSSRVNSPRMMTNYEFNLSVHAPKHEATAAHVSATDKISRKEELIAKNREQYIHVFGSSDAAQQYGLAARAKRPRKRFGVPFQGCAERLRRMMNVRFGEAGEVVQV